MLLDYEWAFSVPLSVKDKDIDWPTDKTWEEVSLLAHPLVSQAENLSDYRQLVESEDTTQGDEDDAVNPEDD